MYDVNRVAKEDEIGKKIKDKWRELSTASEYPRACEEILEDHRSHPLNITLKL